MKRLFKIWFCTQLIAACASGPKLTENDVIPSPELATQLSIELAQLVSPSSCKVLKCVRLKSEENHFICEGEYSLVISDQATEFFKNAVKKVLTDKMIVDFKAEESFGSRLFGAFLGGVGGGLAAGAVGGGGHSLYSGGGSYESVQFSLPIRTTLRYE